MRADGWILYYNYSSAKSTNKGIKQTVMVINNAPSVYNRGLCQTFPYFFTTLFDMFWPVVGHDHGNSFHTALEITARFMLL